MVIKKIEICNYRIFYKENTFELANGLNLILGWHGDGKTTFYDALEWLFRTDGTNKMDIKYISKKRIEELSNGGFDNVRVAMTYEHKGKIKVLEKVFRFTKSFDGEVGTSNYTFSLIEQDGIERVVKDGLCFDKDIPSEIRKFIMFRSNSAVEILHTSNTLKLLIDNLSDIKSYDAYCSFLEYVSMNAGKTRDNAHKLDKKNTDRIKQLNRTIEQERTALADIECEIQLKANEAVNYDNLLMNIEPGKETSKLLVSVNRRIESLSQKRSETSARIKENYSRNLLEDMWVLMGFEKIADEFSYKVHRLGRERRRLEQTHLIKQGGKNSAPLFINNYVPSLEKQDVILNYTLAEITQLPYKIQETIAFNNRLHDDIKKIDSTLAIEYEQKKRILTQTDGLSEEQLLANYDNISDWIDKKNRAINRIDILKRQREAHRALLEEAEMALSKISEGTDAAKYAKIALMFHHISNAFKVARKTKMEQSIMMIEDKANMFLYQLLPDCFTGSIRIIDKQNGQGEIFLSDDDGNRIFYPDYSLQKNTIFAITLAIGEVMSENDGMDYPLIFDGSLSAYDNEYGNPLTESVDRQMIVMTSDYIKRNATEMRAVDIETMPSKLGNVYYMEKRVPFDSRKLSTLQVSISKIK